MEKLLITACQNGQKGVVTAFLKKEGICVNAVDESGCAPLHYACKTAACKGRGCEFNYKPKRYAAAYGGSFRK